MVHPYLKVGFISLVMENLGFIAIHTTKAKDPATDVVYWVDGLTGFFNQTTKEHVSFNHAQLIVSSMLNILKRADSRYVEHGMVRILTSREVKYQPYLRYTELADTIGQAAYATSFHILLGDFKGVVYCSRKKLLKDEANGITLYTHTVRTR